MNEYIRITFHHVTTMNMMPLMALAKKNHHISVNDTYKTKTSIALGSQIFSLMATHVESRKRLPNLFI